MAVSCAWAPLELVTEDIAQWMIRPPEVCTITPRETVMVLIYRMLLH